MLFLTRKIGDSVLIGDNIEVTVLEISGKSVKLAFQYPPEVKVLRREVYDRIQAENQLAADSVVEVVRNLPEFKSRG